MANNKQVLVTGRLVRNGQEVKITLTGLGVPARYVEVELKSTTDKTLLTFDIAFVELDAALARLRERGDVS